MKQSVPKRKVKDDEVIKTDEKPYYYYGNGQSFSSATQFTTTWEIPSSYSSRYTEATHDRLNDEINKLRNKFIEKDNEYDEYQKKSKRLYRIILILNIINVVLNIINVVMRFTK